MGTRHSYYGNTGTYLLTMPVGSRFIVTCHVTVLGEQNRFNSFTESLSLYFKTYIKEIYNGTIKPRNLYFLGGMSEMSHNT